MENQSDRLQNTSTESNVALRNIQKDQSETSHTKLQKTQESPPTYPDVPTEASFISYHATKTPGKVTNLLKACSQLNVYKYILLYY